MTSILALNPKRWRLAAAFLVALIACDMAESSPTIKLLVLDLELVGDVDVSLANTHEERIRSVSNLLRQELSQLPSYEIVDTVGATERIEQLRAVQYLHKCNGCEIDLGVELGADQVLVAWVHRVSHLVLSLTYEIREVPSGRPVERRTFGFRGDNDNGWSRAVTYMVKDLAESHAHIRPSHQATLQSLNVPKISSR